MPQLPTGVIQQFLHPPLGVLTRELIPGVFSGSGTLQRIRGPIGVDAFGLLISFFTVPAGYGYVLGDVKIYDVRMVQLAVVHTLLDGHQVTSERFEIHTEGEPILWQEALPTQVEYSIAPGVSVTFSWLLAL